jgi:hypothetical protein
MKLFQVSSLNLLMKDGQPTIAPILPLMVMTRPMIALPRTQAPIANFQLRPTLIMEEAAPPKFQHRHVLLTSL